MRTEETTFDKIRTRPRFKMITHLEVHELEKHLKVYLRSNSEFTGNINRETALIQVKTEQNPFWKPILSLRAEKEEGETVIRGIFGPTSAVWTFFMFLYFIFSISWMVTATLWYVGKEIKTEKYNWGLPVSIFILVLIGLTYLASRIGQKKAHSEMEKLRSFVIDSTLKYEKTKKYEQSV